MKKDTIGKTKVSLIPYTALRKIAKIREYGIEKYKDDKGWMDVPVEDFVEATVRHGMKWLEYHKYGTGSYMDEESGMDHLHHMACSSILAIGKDE